jgi:hypothetical protein
MWGREPFKGTITLRKQIGGVRLMKWRRDKQRTRIWGDNNVPYNLAMYLLLMPKQFPDMTFTAILYDFTCKDLDDLVESTEVTKITRRCGGLQVTITLDLTNV